MVTSELPAELHKLSRAEKLRVVQFLVNDLVVQEATLSPADETYLKYDLASNGATVDVLLKMLQAAEAQDPPPSRD